MTEENTTTEPEVDEVESQNSDNSHSSQESRNSEIEPTDDTGRKGNDEAAKWRVRFREAETSNAALTARVAALQASAITGMATGPGKLHDGADLLAHVDLEHLLDEDGEIDPDKVTDAIDDLSKSKPHLMKPVFSGDVGQGQRGQAGGSPSWHDVIAG